MKELHLINTDKVALVDDEDWERVRELPWYFQRARTTQYAVTSKMVCGEVLAISLHRFLLQPPNGMMVDHINGDGLDNRRYNLRLATASQNRANSKVRKSNISGFKGVTLRPHRGSYMVRILVGDKREYVGEFWSPELAAMAYDKRAREVFGEYARLNFP